MNENISKLNSTIDFDETRIEDLEENDQKHTEAISNIEDNIDTLRSEKTFRATQILKAEF